MAASRTEAARPRTAFEIEPRKVSGGASFTCSSLEAFFEGVSGFAAEPVVSLGAELKAETAAEPIPITALPSKLKAEVPVSSNTDEAVLLVSSSGGGGRGSSSSFDLVICSPVAIVSFLGLPRPRFDLSSIAFLDGVGGGERGFEMEARLAG